ncbi:hypothetical protein GCM10027341_14730 [Spirosoma knui]
MAKWEQNKVIVFDSAQTYDSQPDRPVGCRMSILIEDYSEVIGVLASAKKVEFFKYSVFG